MSFFSFQNETIHLKVHLLSRLSNGSLMGEDPSAKLHWQ